MSESETAPFVRLGPERPTSPVVLSVPHAGRHYSADLLSRARLSPAMLETLEDRMVDRLIWRATAAGAAAIVAQAPRAEIDLNRGEREIDPLMVTPALPSGSVDPTIRSRGGLGLVPSRITGAGPIWIDRLPRAELSRRIERIHRPYHQALERELDEARTRFGAAILLDCHSMPPRPEKKGAAPLVVLGDRHGTSCAREVMEAAAAAAEAVGFQTARNHPYAGGYIAHRHGRPDRDIHALQIEIDRRAYLDASLRRPGAGFEDCCAMIAALVRGLEESLPLPNLPLAAE